METWSKCQRYMKSRGPGRKLYPRLMELGGFVGIRQGDLLVSMACLRLNLSRYREISTVATLPQHTGRGYATALVGELASRIRNAGKQAFLTVNTSNERAYAIYNRLGFRSRVNLCSTTFRGEVTREEAQAFRRKRETMKLFRTIPVAALLISSFAAACIAQKSASDAAEATKKLGAFIGKWTTSGTFASGEKATTQLECRWSPQGYFLVCEQHVKLSSREQQQLTVYSYNPNDNTYQYATFSDPGQKPSSGAVEIKGNVWTYNSSFEPWRENHAHPQYQ